MKELFPQIGSTAGTAYAAACCAGARLALAALIGLWTSPVVLFLGLGLIVASSFWHNLGARASR